MTMNVKLPSKDLYVVDAKDVFEIMQKVLARELRVDKRPKEFFWVLALNTESRLINIQLITAEGLEFNSIHPVEVFKTPLMLNACCIILCHNHLSGSLDPSANDRNLTEKLQFAQEFYNISLIDHVIINETGYHSFRDSEW